MARPRHQHGWLEESSGKWIAYWYAYIRLDDGSEQRRRLFPSLALYAQRPLFEKEMVN